MSRILPQVGAFFLLFTALAFAEQKENQFNIEDLEKILQNQAPRSLEELLPLLPAEFRTNPVLVQSSRSAQGAMPLLPRVLLSNQDGSFIASFSANDRSLGGKSLEMIQFHPKEARFEFAELKFEADASPLMKRNTQTCAGCHGAGYDMRPNWEAFPETPGMYGANMDRIAVGSEEEQNLTAFIENAKSHPRYSSLIDLESTHLTRDKDGRMKGRANSLFGEKIQTLNLQRIAKRVPKTKDYDLYKYSILASLYCEKDPAFASKFFPKNSEVPRTFSTLEEGGSDVRPAAFAWGFYRRGAMDLFWTASFGDVLNQKPIRMENVSSSKMLADLLIAQDPDLRIGEGKSFPTCSALEAKAKSKLAK
jgi:hypothetical protein